MACRYLKCVMGSQPLQVADFLWETESLPPASPLSSPPETIVLYSHPSQACFGHLWHVAVIARQYWRYCTMPTYRSSTQTIYVSLYFTLPCTWWVKMWVTCPEMLIVFQNKHKSLVIDLGSSNQLANGRILPRKSEFPLVGGRLVDLWRFPSEMLSQGNPGSQWLRGYSRRNGYWPTGVLHVILTPLSWAWSAVVRG